MSTPRSASKCEPSLRTGAQQRHVLLLLGKDLLNLPQVEQLFRELWQRLLGEKALLLRYRGDDDETPNRSSRGLGSRTDYGRYTPNTKPTHTHAAGASPHHSTHLKITKLLGVSLLRSTTQCVVSARGDKPQEIATAHQTHAPLSAPTGTATTSTPHTFIAITSFAAFSS